MYDIVIYTNSCQDHLHHLREVLSRLCNMGLIENPKKCHPGMPEAQYLWYCIGWGLLKLEEKQIEAVCNYSHYFTFLLLPAAVYHLSEFLQ